jgi:hypothetical protein
LIKYKIIIRLCNPNFLWGTPGDKIHGPIYFAVGCVYLGKIILKTKFVVVIINDLGDNGWV